MVKPPWIKLQRVSRDSNYPLFNHINTSTGFNSSQKEVDESIADLKLQAWIVLRKKVDEELADTMLLLKLRSRWVTFKTEFARVGWFFTHN